MSEPVPTPVTLSDEQLEELAIRVAKYLPSYLIYRSAPTVPAGSVVPPEGVIQSSEDMGQMVPVTVSVTPPEVKTLG